MKVMNVLCVPNSFQFEASEVVLRSIECFLDESSLFVLNSMRQASILNRKAKDIQDVQQSAALIDLEEDIPFSEIPGTLRTDKCLQTSPGFCLAFLKTVAGAGEENTAVRRSFFGDGKPLVSTQPFRMNGQFHYLIIGQNQCEVKNGQKPFSIRTLCEPTVFNHSLYKLLAAKNS